MRLDYARDPDAEQCSEEQVFRNAIGAHGARDLFEADAALRPLVKLGRRGAGDEGVAELRDAAGGARWSNVLPGPDHPPAATCASLMGKK